MPLMCIHNVFRMTPAKDSCKHIIIHGKKWNTSCTRITVEVSSALYSQLRKKHITCATNCTLQMTSTCKGPSKSMKTFFFIIIIITFKPLRPSVSLPHNKTLRNPKTTVATHATHPTYSHLISSNNTPTTPLTPPQHPVLLYLQKLLLSGFFNLVVSLKCPTLYLNIRTVIGCNNSAT